MTAAKLDVRDFGDALIRSGDLDPAYIGLHGAALPRPQLARWLLSYWCFYHVGAASYMSEQEGEAFWDAMLLAAANNVSPKVRGLPSDRWPRAAERRHFRGEKCVSAVSSLRERHPTRPEDLVLRLISSVDSPFLTEKKVMGWVQEWPMFGPWIAFKAADMLERVAGVPVKFDSNLGMMYEEPARALKVISEDYDYMGTRYDRQWWYNNLSLYFRRHLAPPARDRTCGPQELETVLCKWKSYLGGHYWLGKDTREHREALVGWGQTASLMLKYMPKEVEQ